MLPEEVIRNCSVITSDFLVEKDIYAFPPSTSKEFATIIEPMSLVSAIPTKDIFGPQSFFHPEILTDVTAPLLGFVDAVPVQDN